MPISTALPTVVRNVVLPTGCGIVEVSVHSVIEAPDELRRNPVAPSCTTSARLPSHVRAGTSVCKNSAIPVVRPT